MARSTTYRSSRRSRRSPRPTSSCRCRSRRRTARPPRARDRRRGRIRQSLSTVSRCRARSATSLQPRSTAGGAPGRPTRPRARSGGPAVPAPDAFWARTPRRMRRLSPVRRSAGPRPRRLDRLRRPVRGQPELGGVQASVDRRCRLQRELPQRRALGRCRAGTSAEQRRPRRPLRIPGRGADQQHGHAGPGTSRCTASGPPRSALDHRRPARRPRQQGLAGGDGDHRRPGPDRWQPVEVDHQGRPAVAGGPRRNAARCRACAPGGAPAPTPAPRARVSWPAQRRGVRRRGSINGASSGSGASSPSRWADTRSGTRSRPGNGRSGSSTTSRPCRSSGRLAPAGPRGRAIGDAPASSRASATEAGAGSRRR